MRWPFAWPRQSRSVDSDAARRDGGGGRDDGGGRGVGAAESEPRGAEALLPPMPGLLAPMPLTVSRQFREALAGSQGLPSIVRPLSHAVAIDGPKGGIWGLARAMRGGGAPDPGAALRTSVARLDARVAAGGWSADDGGPADGGATDGGPAEGGGMRGSAPDPPAVFGDAVSPAPDAPILRTLAAVAGHADDARRMTSVGGGGPQRGTSLSISRASDVAHEPGAAEPAGPNGPGVALTSDAGVGAGAAPGSPAPSAEGHGVAAARDVAVEDIAASAGAPPQSQVSRLSLGQSRRLGLGAPLPGLPSTARTVSRLPDAGGPARERSHTGANVPLPSTAGIAFEAPVPRAAAPFFGGLPRPLESLRPVDVGETLPSADATAAASDDDPTQTRWPGPRLSNAAGGPDLQRLAGSQARATHAGAEPGRAAPIAGTRQVTGTAPAAGSPRVAETPPPAGSPRVAGTPPAAGSPPARAEQSRPPDDATVTTDLLGGEAAEASESATVPVAGSRPVIATIRAGAEQAHNFGAVASHPPTRSIERIAEHPSPTVGVAQPGPLSGAQIGQVQAGQFLPAGVPAAVSVAVPVASSAFPAMPGLEPRSVEPTGRPVQRAPVRGRPGPSPFGPFNGVAADRAPGQPVPAEPLPAEPAPVVLDFVVSRTASVQTASTGPEAAPAAGAPPAPPASGAPASAAASTPSIAAADELPEGQLDQLARRLYGRIRDRLRADLVRERERAGVLPDL